MDSGKRKPIRILLFEGESLNLYPFRPDDLAKGEAYYNYAMRKTSISELPGISVFYKDVGDTVFHTYSCYARGLDMMNAAYHYLDLVPKGRDEGGRGIAWLRYRDSY